MPWWVWLLSAKAVLITLAVVLGLVAVVGIMGGAPSRAQKASGSCGGTIIDVAVTGTAPNLTAEQNANAQAIAGVALGLGLGERGVLIGILTALTESTLIAVNYGDYSSNGVMTTSRGLFQQKQEWGPLEDRLDPAKSATLFYTGGQAGQDGLMDIEGWETMDPGVAMQAVQKSQFSGGSSPGYAGKLAQATAATEALMAAQPAADDVVVVAAATTPPAPENCTGAPVGTGAAPGAYAGPVDGAQTETDPTGTGGMLTKATLAAYNALIAAYPPKSASCWDEHAWNPTSDHPKGRACDIYYGSAGVYQNRVEPENAARAWEAAHWLEANAAALNVSYLIWEGKYWGGEGSTWGPYSSGIYDVANDPVGGHYDHIHLSIKGNVNQ